MMTNADRLRHEVDDLDDLFDMRRIIAKRRTIGIARALGQWNGRGMRDLGFGANFDLPALIWFTCSKQPR